MSTQQSLAPSPSRKIRLELPSYRKISFGPYCFTLAKWWVREGQVVFLFLSVFLCLDKHTSLKAIHSDIWDTEMHWEFMTLLEKDAVHLLFNHINHSDEICCELIHELHTSTIIVLHGVMTLAVTGKLLPCWLKWVSTDFPLQGPEILDTPKFLQISTSNVKMRSIHYYFYVKDFIFIFCKGLTSLPLTIINKTETEPAYPRESKVTGIYFTAQPYDTTNQMSALKIVDLE